MPLFTWLDNLDESEWTQHREGGRFMVFTREQMAERCQLQPQDVVSQIRRWVRSQNPPRYVVAWSESDDPSSLVIVSKTAGETIQK